MDGWFIDAAGTGLGSVLFWLVAIAFLVALFLAIYWLFRRVATGAFIAGGRNRKRRVAVLDVAAVDSRRRLVLIRRDETEHLIMIGGPSDLIIEQGIRKKSHDSKVLTENSERLHENGRAPVVPPVTVQPVQPKERKPVEPVLGLPAASPPAIPAVEPAPKPKLDPPASDKPEFDSALLHELETSLENKPEPAAPVKTEDRLSSIFADIRRTLR